MDNALISRLNAVLEQETKIYEAISKISKSKTNIIVQGKVQELENMVKLEQALILQLGKLENEREKTVENLAKQLDIKSSQFTISELARHLGGEAGQKLKTYQEHLARSINNLKDANELNSKLIKNSLEYIEFSINLISSVGAGTNNYGNSGHVNDPGKRTFFDMKL